VLDDDMLMKRVKELNDSYGFAKTIFEKQKRVWEKNVGSEVEYLQAKNNLENLENRMELLKEEVDNARIKAPFSGVIDKVYIKEGQMASPSMPAFRIVSQSNLQIRTDVAESVSYRLTEGSEAKVFFPDLKLDTLNLKISAISEGIDRVNRTVSVYVNLPKAVYNKVKPAMLASVRYKTAKIDSALTIPTNIIQKEGTTDYVFVVAKNEKGKTIADKKIIVVGKSFSGVTQVEGGITNSDKLITVGYENLREGDLIKFN
jgi:RND family efflux transporter MFP subunit